MTLRASSGRGSGGKRRWWRGYDEFIPSCAEPPVCPPAWVALVAKWTKTTEEE